MRIAYLSREYPPDTLWGGEAIVHYTLTSALAKHGHEVHVICQAIDKPKDLLQEGVFVHRVGTNPKRYSAIARINYSFHAYCKLREVIEKYRIEIVEASYWSAEGFPYCLRKQVPLIVKTQSFPRDAIRAKNYSGIKELINLKILSLLADFTARRADMVISDSRSNYERVIKELSINPEKVNIVHHAINISKYRFVKSNIREKLAIPLDVPLILFVGRLEARKGLHILSQAMPGIASSISDARFVLVGKDTSSAPGGSSFKQYLLEEAQAHNLQDNLVFVDFLPEDELIQLYSACDVFVFPSLHESFGLPTLEAMSCRRPVVATSTGIIPELEPFALRGLEVVPVGDAHRLAKATIKMLLLGDGTKKWIGKENRGLVKTKFFIPTWVDKMIEVYVRTLRSSSKKKARGKQS